MKSLCPYPGGPCVTSCNPLPRYCAARSSNCNDPNPCHCMVATTPCEFGGTCQDDGHGHGYIKCLACF
jgi:hypothetical protein